MEQLTSKGAEIDSIAYCGDEPATNADIRLVNGALVGWVPVTSVASVTVEAPYFNRTAKVVSQHFILAAAPSTTTGWVAIVTGRLADGQPVFVWHVTTK